MVGRIFPLLLVLALGTAPLRADLPAKDLKRDPRWVKKVHTAIEKGVAWLLTRQNASGRFPAYDDARGAVYELGMHALATLAVVKGGADLEGRPVRRAYRALHKLAEKHANNLYTYDAGLVLMALDAKYYAVPPKKKSYKDAGKKKKFKQAKISSKDLALAQRLATWLQTKQHAEGLWRYPQDGMDLSNTQYAALGLWSAQRLGVKINRGVVRRMIEATLKRQQPAGTRVPFIQNPRRGKKGERKSGTQIDARGWRYMPTERITQKSGKIIERNFPYSGSMTTAGVAILAIGRTVLGPKDSWLTKAQDRKLRRAMWEGLAWLQANWKIRDNPGQPGNWKYYWLYGLERAGRLSGVETIGYHDWFVEGASYLLTEQRANGSWPRTPRPKAPGSDTVRWGHDQVDTAFAVLFLALSSPALDIPAPTITGGGAG